MKKLSVKKLLVLFTLFVVVVMFATRVEATGVINPLNLQNGGTTTNTVTTNTTTTNTTTNTVTTNTVGSTYQGTNLPQTGDASDYAIFLFITVCVIVAVYAYRRYKTYNI